MISRILAQLEPWRTSVLRRVGAHLDAWAQRCFDQARPQSQPKLYARQTRNWHDLTVQLGSQRVMAELMNSGAIGHEMSGKVVHPSFDRVLVLAAHQDDEMIGAGGTFLLAARRRTQFRVVYYTDGATGLGSLAPEETVAMREREARRIWARIAATEPHFLRYPNRFEGIDPQAGDELASILQEFQPTVIFLPNFLEQPEDHRKMNLLLMQAASKVNLSPKTDVYGYQITTRSPGTAVVNITSVWKRKYRLNRLWKSQNAMLDYAHLAMGRDIANSYFLKGGNVRKHPASHAEVFLAFRLPAYLRLCQLFYAMPESPDERFEVRPADFHIIGMQKSGTYWLTALLDRHPEIRCFPSRPGHEDGTGEAHLFDLLARMENDYRSFRKSMRSKLGGYFSDLLVQGEPTSPAQRQALTVQICRRFDEYCSLQRATSGKSIVGEKTTESVHHPELMDRLYRGVRKICILRDPRDRVVSFHYHQIRKGRRESASIDRAFVEAYLERVEKDYRGLLAISEPLHLLTYEQMQQQPAATLRDLLRFLNVADDEETIRRIHQAASFEILAARPAGQHAADSHFRKGIVGDWKSQLKPEDAVMMTQRLAELTEQIERRFGLDLSSYAIDSSAARLSGVD